MSLYSSRWHRVSALRPGLSPQLQVRRQRVRGVRWVVLSDPVSARSVRLNVAAWAFAARLDGQRSVQQLWDAVMVPGAQGADQDPASQDEWIQVLAQLSEAGLLQAGASVDAGPAAPLDDTAQARPRASLLAWRLPLGNPSAWLDRLVRWQALIFHPLTGVVWLLALGNSLLLAAQHAPDLWHYGVQWLATPRLAWLAMLLYVPIKLLHELAHGLAVRRWGGQVRQAGITLMMGMPVPWVDASAAAAWASRRQRLAVGAAGIVVELGLASLALPCWLALDDGPARELAFVILFICGVSTVVFNANPLQRLDGYYLLTDALDLPNLAPRSRQWWSQALLRRALGDLPLEPMPVAPGETPWLALYAPLSWVYGLFIASLAVLWLGQWSAGLGVVCGGVLAWQMLWRPVTGLVRPVRAHAASQQRLARRWRRGALGLGLALLLVLLLPVPQTSLVQAVVWPSDDAQLRADEAGVVSDVLAQDGQLLQVGDPVLQLHNPGLLVEQAAQRARVAALEALLYQSLTGTLPGADESGRAGNARADLDAAQAALSRLDERVAALLLRAHAAGRLALPQAPDLPGQFVSQGSLLGHVLTGEPPALRVALPEAQARDLRAAPPRFSVRLAASPGRQWRAELLRDSVGAARQLPSAALSRRHGGDVATDPEDKQDLTPLQPVVVLALRLQAPPGEPQDAPTPRLGERAWVRLDDGHAPLIWQALRGLQRSLQQRFNPQV